MPRLELFLAAPSSSYDSGNWIVYEAHDPGQVLFVGAREAAEFEADRRSRHAREAYPAAVSAALADKSRQEWEHKQATMMKDFMSFLEWRLHQEEDCGLANIHCRSALSLPG